MCGLESGPLYLPITSSTSSFVNLRGEMGGIPLMSSRGLAEHGQLLRQGEGTGWIGLWVMGNG